MNFSLQNFLSGKNNSFYYFLQVTKTKVFKVLDYRGIYFYFSSIACSKVSHSEPGELQNISFHTSPSS